MLNVIRDFFLMYFLLWNYIEVKILCICCNIDDWKFFNVRLMILIVLLEILCVFVVVYLVVF